MVLSAVILFSAATPVYAANAEVNVVTENSNSIALSTTINENNSKISKDEAKNIAKKALSEYLGVTIDDVQYQTNVNFTPNYRSESTSKDYVWQISWNSHNQDKNVNINVSINANSGKITNIDNYTYTNSQTPAVATITEDKAKEIGESFLNKINPKEFSQCKLSDNSDSNNSLNLNLSGYSFNYYRAVNGIPFLKNYITVRVDGVTGSIRSYNIMWNDNQVPELSKDNIISTDKANDVLKNNLKLKLKYIPTRDQYGLNNLDQNLKLVYTIDSPTSINIDAKDGKVVSNIDLTQKKTKDLDASQKKAFIDSYKSLQKLSKELDSNSAEEIMKQIIKDVYGDNYDIQSINYQENNRSLGNNKSSWYGQFKKKGVTNDSTNQGNIQIDASTGQLISIRKFNPYNNMISSDDANTTVKAKLTWEQAYDKAISSVQKYFPDKVKDLATEQTYSPRIDSSQINRNYGFNFNRLINGISYQNNNINIEFDSITGDLISIYSSWDDALKVPSTDGCISSKDAQKIFFAKYNPKLSYSLINTSKDSKNPVMEVKLIYSMENGLQYSQFNNIDAITGKFVNYNGQQIDNDLKSFKEKIKGSSLENELNILASSGIINTKDFDLNKQVSRLDLIKMLVNAKGYTPYTIKSVEDLKINYAGKKGDETYNYLQMAISYGILENSGDFKGDEIVTREEMIKDIVKLTGYDKLAQAKDTFIVKYSDAKDISPENLGYVAISKALGYNNDADNKFKPKDKVTIKDAAFSIYKSLGDLRSNRK